jgi:site-specific recombinase XerD
MDRKPVSGPETSRKGQKQPKPQGLQLKERGGFWHVVGTVRVGGRTVRIRKSTGLPARPEYADQAAALRVQTESQLINEAVYGIKPSVPLAIAARDFLSQTRSKPLGFREIGIIKDITRQFGHRQVDNIQTSEWRTFVDTRNIGNRSETRERYLNGVVSFLHFCTEEGREWLSKVPDFKRDKQARNPNHRSKRRVEDLTPDLIAIMIESAGPHLKAQLAVEWSTGARVSSVLHGVRLCDVNLAYGREQITFHETKNGTTVTAALHTWAADKLREYLNIRGKLENRDGPLFLTHLGQEYSQQGRSTQNKTAWNGMKRRTIKTIRTSAARQAWALRTSDPDEAINIIKEAKSSASLVERVTQHWFRHLMANRLLKSGADIKTVMAQGGWLDPKSVIGYSHDVPDYRRDKINEMQAPGTSSNTPDAARFRHTK